MRRGPSPSRSTSVQRRPKASPRRMPVMDRVRHRECRRVSRVFWRKVRSCSPVQVFISFFSLVRTAGGSAASTGLRCSRFQRTASRSALCRVAWMRRTVAGESPVGGLFFAGTLHVLGPLPTFAAPATLSEELPVEGVDPRSGELHQGHRADVRGDVDLDVGLVAHIRRGPHRGLDRREPLVAQVFGQGELRRLHVGVGSQGAEDLVESVLGVLLGAKARPAALATLGAIFEIATAAGTHLQPSTLDPEALVAQAASGANSYNFN